MGTVFNALVAEARNLGEHTNTAWAKEHANEYDAFEYKLEELFEEDRLTAEEFNELATIARLLEI